MSDNNLKITLAPNPLLRKVSAEVQEDEFGAELQAKMDLMLEKMYELNGVGLSGVQVGDARRILVADAGDGEGPIRIVNPKITRFSEEKVQYAEGCLSAPGLRVSVERSEEIDLECFDPMGNKISGTLKGLKAVIIQHEIDHLDGKTLVDLLSPLKKDMYIKKLKKKQKKLSRQIKQLKKKLGR